jgi:hypothetical protein
MKKLLVLLLVLGMISVTNAGTLTIDVEVGGVDYAGQALAPGTEVTVKIIQTATDTAGAGGEMYVAFAGTPVSITDNTPGPAVYDPGPPASLYGWNWLLNGGVSMIDQGGGVYHAWKGAAANPGVGTPGVGAVMDPLGPIMYSNTYEFKFQVGDGDTDLVWGGTWDGDLDGIAETIIVPEPMTIALLGLGGLFLRRRK